MRRLGPLVGALLGLAGCDYRELKIPVDPTYSSLSAVTIRPKCVRCHESLSSYDGVRATVVPGDPEASRLYTVVRTGFMPRQTADLSDAELEAMAEWIRLGAAND